MLLDLTRVVWRDDPYRIGLAKTVLDEDTYKAMVDTFPDETIMGNMGVGYSKFALSERVLPTQYANFVKEHPVWHEFHRYIKKTGFLAMIAKLTSLEVGFYRTRWEFSSMPAVGGKIDPHTDIASKVVTLIVPMVRPGEWDQSWGGGTDVLKPLDPDEVLVDYKAPLSKFEKVATCEFEPNQACVFIKSAKSWHSVGPIAGPEGKWRRSLTINVEKSQ